MGASASKTVLNARTYQSIFAAERSRYHLRVLFSILALVVLKAVGCVTRTMKIFLVRELNIMLIVLVA